jgi:outer membrane lipoprotein SlyB
MEALPQDLADFLVTKNFDPEYFDAQGQPAEAGDAKTMKFDYVAGTGKNYGTAVCVVADDELNLFYGDNLGRGMDPEDKDEWFSFLEELSNKAASHSATWSPRDINQLKHTLAGIAAIKEGLFEGYYGSRRVSYMGEQTQARLVIKHNRTLGEDDKRYRYVESLFIETADQERFRLPFKSLAGGRAMLEHVRQGGRPYDVRGNHITEVVSEMAVLSRFNRAQHNRVFEGVTQELVESAKQYYHNLQETVKHLGSTRGYQAYFESWAPDQTGEAESLVENLRNMFVEQTLDARIEAALPTLAKIQQQGMNMKEAQIFENWINNLSEGTWALPETPEQMEKLNQLMSGELIVGPDATNATEQLYDIVGDDELFDILNDLADRSEGRANIWDDSDVQRRLAELGVQTPQSTAAEPADVGQDTAPEVKEDQLDEIDIDTLNQLASHPMAGTMAAAGGAALGGVIGKGIEKAADWYKGKKEQQALARHKQQAMAEGDNLATFVEDRELSTMLKYAGVPIREGVLNDDTRNTWDHLLDRFRHEVEQFRQGSDLDSDLYDALFDYYDQHGAMPYRVRNAKDGTANQWISSRLADDLGIDEGVLGTVGGAALGGMLGGPIGASVGATGGQELTKGGSNIIEGSCNMTMEGEYCPEHGLMECGSMEEDGGAVGMPYSMGEAQAPQDPINSNSAMTGSYYEGKETDIQEGDALLARIKSLALLR